MGASIDIKAADGSGQFQRLSGHFSLRQRPGGRVAAEDLQSQWHHREIADYYAEEGYMVLAPGLFWCQ